MKSVKKSIVNRKWIKFENKMPNLDETIEVKYLGEIEELILTVYSDNFSLMTPNRKKWKNSALAKFWRPIKDEI